MTDLGGCLSSHERQVESSLSKLEEVEVGEILWIGAIGKMGIGQNLALIWLSSDGSSHGIVFQITAEDVLIAYMLRII